VEKSKDKSRIREDALPAALWPPPHLYHTKPRQNSVKNVLVNWFTMVLFDVEIRLPDHWVKLWKY
jgi:hypothetical protein